MATLEVYPRETPEERAEALVPVEVEEDLAVMAGVIEDWVAARATWELLLRQGTDFGRANNVEAELLYVQGEQASRLVFRLDQLERTDDTGEQLVLVLDEEDGIAKLVRLSARGFDVELFHILTYT